MKNKIFYYLVVLIASLFVATNQIFASELSLDLSQSYSLIEHNSAGPDSVKIVLNNGDYFVGIQLEEDESGYSLQIENGRVIYLTKSSIDEVINLKHERERELPLNVKHERLKPSSKSYVIQVRPKGPNHWGYCNLQGEFYFEKKYNMCHGFSEDGIAVIEYPKRNFYEFVRLNGELVKLEIDHYVVPYLKGGAGIRRKGYSEGFIILIKDGKKGCLDTDGKIAIPFIYDYFSRFNGGFAVAKKGAEYFIFNTKREKIKVEIPGLKEIKYFSEGLARIRTKEGFGFINEKGKVVIPPKFDGTGFFEGELAWARNKKGNIGFINKKGEWVIESKYVGAQNFDIKSGLAKVKLFKGWIYIDKLGEVRLFKNVFPIGNFSEGFCKAEKQDKWGFINNKGEWVVEAKYEGVRAFKNGYAAVKMDGMWGLIDANGNWVLRPEFPKLKDVNIVYN